MKTATKAELNDNYHRRSWENCEFQGDFVLHFLIINITLNK